MGNVQTVQYILQFSSFGGRKNTYFFLHYFFLCFCKLANGPIHPPIWPPLLHPFFIKTLLLGPPAITGLPGAPKSTQGCPRVPPGTLFYRFWLPFGSAWVPPGPFRPIFLWIWDRFGCNVLLLRLGEDTQCMPPCLSLNDSKSRGGRRHWILKGYSP